MHIASPPTVDSFFIMADFFSYKNVTEFSAIFVQTPGILVAPARETNDDLAVYQGPCEFIARFTLLNIIHLLLSQVADLRLIFGQLGKEFQLGV